MKRRAGAPGAVGQRQLVLPLLEAMAEAGGRARTADLYDPVCRLAGIDPARRAERVPVGASSVGALDRTIRWAQQRARLMGLAARVGPGDWVVTGRGHRALREARPGLVVTVYATSLGVALWASCEDAVGHIEDGSCALVFTSPPYPLLREKGYGNPAEAEYVDWLLAIARTWPRILAADGSVVLNLGDAWRRGEPTVSLYQERLLLRLEDEVGLRLCQRAAWHNPSALPAPAEWVTVRRVRMRPALEQLYWLSASASPKADNRRALVPYSAAMRRRLAAGGERGGARPSGHAMAPGAFSRDNGGAIASNLLSFPNSASNDAYARRCREAGVEPHPARFPVALPEHFVRLLTEEGDLVYDPFGGSGTTAAAAEGLGRRWVTSERVLPYVEGSRLRFPDAVVA